MADSSGAGSGKTSFLGGKIKTFVATFAGLLSGAVMMYVTPLFDKAIKPSKPVANFGVQLGGLTATFQNRSSAGEGWWDFGDGSPLEPLAPDQETVTHTYPRPGSYTAKLTLRNFIGDESERSVTIDLDGGQGDQAGVLALEAAPISPGAFAPATFRLVGRVQNAPLCVWSYGDSRPLEFQNDPAAEQEKMVTFDRPGNYVIKLATLSGKQPSERSVVVTVKDPPPGTLSAVLTVTERATQVDKKQKTETVVESLSEKAKGNSQPIDRKIKADPGYEIVEAKYQIVQGKGDKDLRLEIAGDRRSAKLTGEMVRGSGGMLKRGRTVPNLVIQVTLKQERRTPAPPRQVPVTATLAVPGTAVLMLPPVPRGWTDIKRNVRLELRQGGQVVCQHSELPRNAPVTVGSHNYWLTAKSNEDKVKVELVEAVPGRTPAAN